MTKTVPSDKSTQMTTVVHMRITEFIYDVLED